MKTGAWNWSGGSNAGLVSGSRPALKSGTPYHMPCVIRKLASIVSTTGRLPRRSYPFSAAYIAPVRESQPSPNKLRNPQAYISRVASALPGSNRRIEPPHLVTPGITCPTLVDSPKGTKAPVSTESAGSGVRKSGVSKLRPVRTMFRHGVVCTFGLSLSHGTIDRSITPEFPAGPTLT